MITVIFHYSEDKISINKINIKYADDSNSILRYISEGIKN